MANLTTSVLKTPSFGAVPSLDTVGNGTSTVTDLSGNGNDGIINGATWVADTNNGGVRALQFDGVNDWVDFGDTNDFAGSFSLSCWIWADATLTTAASGGRVVQKRGTGGAGAQAGWGLVVYRTGTEVKMTNCIFDFGNGQSYSPFQYLLGEVETWIHVALIVDLEDGLLSVYYDSMLRDSVDISSSLTSGSFANNRKLTLGASDDSLTQFFKGKVDDVRLYDGQILRPEDIDLLYDSGNGRGLQQAQSGSSIYNPFNMPSGNPFVSY